MKNRKKNLLGFCFGGISGITWALDTIIIGLVLSNISLFNNKEIIILPLVIAFLKDSFSCIALNGYMVIRKRFLYIIKCILKGKVNILILAAVLGGPIGMTIYILSMKFITPEGAANISAIYPIVTAILSAVIIKEKLNSKSKIGVIFSFIGVFIIGYSKMEYNSSFIFIVGVILSILTVLCWSLESILYSFQTLKFSKLNSIDALAIREIVAVIVDIVIISFAYYRGVNVTKVIAHIYPMVFITACISLLSYLLWYKSINLIGPTKATTLNVTYVLWVVIFQIMLFNKYIKFNFILGSILILIGSIFMINYKKSQ